MGLGDRVKVLLYVLVFSIGSSAQYNIDRVITAGRAALYYEDYVLSIQYFNQVISAKPYLYEPWFFRGAAKFYLDDFSGAESDCAQALTLNPYVPGIYELRGLCRIRQKNFEGAISDYDQSIRFDPQSQGLWYNRVLCRIENKDYKAAHLDLDSMMTRWQEYAKAYQLKAEVLLREKDTLRAADFLDKALKIDPYDGEAWAVRAVISCSRKQWKDADKQFSEAIHLHPNRTSFYINRALVRYNTNNLRGAMADYDKAIDLDPENFLAHYNRGQLRIQVGEDNRAINDFDFILKHEPDNIMALYNRALLLDRTGDPRSAIRDYTAVINRFPNFWAGLAQRAQCYRKLGMKAQADQDEYRIVKAQMNKHLGIQNRWSKSKQKEVRKLSDIDMDKYNQLVEADEQKVEHEYESAYRGKVQNRKVDDQYMPLLTLSFFARLTTAEQRPTNISLFDSDIETFNKGRQRPIYMHFGTSQLEQKDFLSINNLINSLSDRIQNLKTVEEGRAQIFDRAILYASLQNLDAAISDLTVYINVDSTNVLAFWQRAICQAMINEFNESQGVDTQIKNARAIDDLSHACRLSPKNPHILYDRAYIYATMKEYSSAIVDYTAAIQLNPNFAEAYFNRGLTRIFAGNTAEGIIDLSKAGELGIYDAYSIMKRYREK